MAKISTIVEKKYKSNKGASITFGLLLFLVCAIISSVILIAGTNAAGRLSDMPVTEQRYYSVVSSCKVVKKLIDNKTEELIDIDDDVFLISNNTFEKVNKTTLEGMESLSKYLTYNYHKNAESSNLELDLRSLISDPQLKTVKLNAYYSKNKIALKVSCDNYSVSMNISVRKTVTPIEIKNNGNILTAKKTSYLLRCGE